MAKKAKADAKKIKAAEDLAVEEAALAPYVPPAVVVAVELAESQSLVADKSTIHFNFMDNVQRLRDDISSEEEDEDSSDDDDDDVKQNTKAKQVRKKNLPKLNEQERMAMENWVNKKRSDGLMLNARWIRHGGGKGKSMTATSSEVMTSGAYEALACYVNKKLGYSASHERFWTAVSGKRRWKSLYTSYTEAVHMEDKGNSLAGTSNQSQKSTMP